MKTFNSATISAPLGLVEAGAGLASAIFPVRCGLIESASGRLLVDTGYGPRVLDGPRSRSLRLYAALLRPKLLPFPELAIDTILLTHFHADHVARLRDFPHARLLASQAALTSFAGMTPAQALKHGIFPELLPPDFLARTTPVEHLPHLPTGTTLGDGYDLRGDGSHLAIALPGHAAGHLGIFWRDQGRPTLYATDVAWTLQALLTGATPRFAQRAVFDDVAAGAATAAKVRAFAAAGGRVLLCHDPA